MRIWVITEYEEVVGVTDSEKKVKRLKAACPNKYEYQEFDTEEMDGFLDGSTWWKYIANPHEKRESVYNYGFERPMDYKAFNEHIYMYVLKAKSNVDAIEKGRAQFLQFAAENPERWTESEVNFYR